MDYYQGSEQNGGRTVLAIALVTLIIVGAVVFGGMFLLARRGALATLLGEPTAAGESQATPAPTWTSIPGAAAQPTAPLLITATPRFPTVTPAGAVQQATLAALTPTAGASPTPAETVTPTATGNAASVGGYRVEYMGCTKHASNTGTVKGQVFDRQGRVVVGAEVFISIDDWAYDKSAVSNGEGWYEFYLQKGQRVKIRALRIKGADMALAGADQEFKARGGCFEYVNLRGQ